MEAAGKYGANYETKRLAEDLKKLKDEGILDIVLPFNQRSWKDIAPTTNNLNYEFKRAVNSTIDTKIEQRWMSYGNGYSLKQRPSFTGSSNFENLPITADDEVYTDVFDKIVSEEITPTDSIRAIDDALSELGNSSGGIENLQFIGDNSLLSPNIGDFVPTVDLPTDDIDTAWEVTKEIINSINPF